MGLAQAQSSVPASLRAYLDLTGSQTEAIQANNDAFNRMLNEARAQVHALGAQRETALAVTPPDLAGAGEIRVREIGIERAVENAQRALRGKNWALLTPVQVSRSEHLTRSLDNEAVITDAVRMRLTAGAEDFPPGCGRRGSGVAAYLLLTGQQWATLCASLDELAANHRLGALRTQQLELLGASAVGPAAVGRIHAEIEGVRRELRALDDQALRRHRGLLAMEQRIRMSLLDAWSQASEAAVAAECVGLIDRRPGSAPRACGGLVEPRGTGQDSPSGVPPGLAAAMGFSAAQRAAMARNDEAYNQAADRLSAEWHARNEAVRRSTGRSPVDPVELGEAHEALRQWEEKRDSAVRVWRTANRAVLTEIQTRTAAEIEESRGSEGLVQDAWALNLLAEPPGSRRFRFVGRVIPVARPGEFPEFDLWTSECDSTGFPPSLRAFLSLGPVQTAKLCDVDRTLSAVLRRLSVIGDGFRNRLAAEERAEARPLVLGALLADISAVDRDMAAAREAAIRGAAEAVTPAQWPTLERLRVLSRRLDLFAGTVCEGLIDPGPSALPIFRVLPAIASAVPVRYARCGGY